MTGCLRPRLETVEAVDSSLDSELELLDELLELGGLAAFLAALALVVASELGASAPLSLALALPLDFLPLAFLPLAFFPLALAPLLFVMALALVLPLPLPFLLLPLDAVVSLGSEATVATEGVVCGDLC